MQKLNKILLVIFVCLFQFNIVFASEEIQTSFKITGFDNKDEISTLKYSLNNINNKEITEGITTINNFQLDLQKGDYIIQIWLDSENTNAFGYYGSKRFNINNNNEDIEILVASIGSLEILILDNKNKPLENILVHIRCEKHYGQQGYFRSDQLGMLFIDNIAEGKCIIRCAYKDTVLSEIINIKQGNFHQINFTIEKENGDNFFVFVIIFLIAFISIILFIFKNKKKNINQNVTNRDEIMEQNNEIKEPIIDYREDAFAVLNKKEKEIIHFLIEHEKNNSKPLYQAKICYGLKIPKTTLSKILPNLESKNLIEIENIGKVKTIKLTSWFKKTD
jgi:cbb3-type cytochrome oxidase subunit 3